MRTINRLSTVLTVLTWILGRAAYPSSHILAAYRSDDSIRFFTLCTQSAQTSVDFVYGLNQKTP